MYNMCEASAAQEKHTKNSLSKYSTGIYLMKQSVHVNSELYNYTDTLLTDDEITMKTWLITDFTQKHNWQTKYTISGYMRETNVWKEGKIKAKRL